MDILVPICSYTWYTWHKISTQSVLHNHNQILPNILFKSTKLYLLSVIHTQGVIKSDLAIGKLSQVMNNGIIDEDSKEKIRNNDWFFWGSWNYNCPSRETTNPLKPPGESRGTPRPQVRSQPTASDRTSRQHLCMLSGVVSRNVRESGHRQPLYTITGAFKRTVCWACQRVVLFHRWLNSVNWNSGTLFQSRI